GGGDDGGPGASQVFFCGVPPVSPPCEDCPPASPGVGGVGPSGGDILGIAPGLADQDAVRRNLSDTDVRYGDGTAWVRTRTRRCGGRGGVGGDAPGGDFGGNGFGTPWGVARYWTNRTCTDAPTGPGDGQAEFPYLRQLSPPSNATIYVISSGLNV